MSKSLHLVAHWARMLVILSCGALTLLALAPNRAAAQAAPDQLRPYTINAGDEIEVYVWGEERLQRVIRILPDGTFAFPLVGKVDALGKLPSAIEAIVTKGLESQYRGQVPQVTVSVKNPSGLQFSVAGKVKAPGTFSPGRYVNVLEALSFAGGPDEFASLDNVTIIRKSGNRLTSLKAKLGQFFKVSGGAREASVAAIPQIESGDTVIVP
jgi:polysaccharide biosynthesis/export protein